MTKLTGLCIVLLLFTFEIKGYFTNSLLYYGFYTNSTPRQACLTPLLTQCNVGVELGYSIPLAYLFIVIISFFITCILLVYSLSKSLGKTLQSEGGLTVWLFSSWDFKVTKKSSVFLRRANINTQLKELISERMAQRRRGWRVWLWQGLVCGLVWTICLACTGVCILGIFLYVKFIHLKTVKHLFGLPLLVSCANLLLPGLFRAVSSAEGFQSPSTQAYVAITRNLLLKTSILSLLTYHWMTDLGTLSDTCWETYAGQELYRHVITDLLMTLLHTIFGEFLWRAGVLFSPLLPAVQLLKLLLVFYIKKASLLRNCRPSDRLWRANQMSTVFTAVLCFPAFTGAAACVAYIMWKMKPSPTCGPFRSLPTMFALEKEWEDLAKAPQSLSWLSVVYTYLLKKPIFLYVIATFLALVIYIHKQRNDGQLELISLLEKQIKYEGEDKNFLISKLKALNQEQQD